MNSTIPEAFFAAAEKFSEKTALRYKKSGVYFPVTYKELALKVKKLHSGLEELGVKKGDAIAILSENRPEWVVADLAIMSLGAIVVPLHITFSPEAMAKILQHANVKIIIVSHSGLLNKLLLVRRKVAFLQQIIFLDKVTLLHKKSLGKKIIGFKKVLLNKEPGSYKTLVKNPEDICSIIYTSGTSGDPKGVALNHRNFLYNVTAVNNVIPIKQGDMFLSFLPLSHVLERTGGYYMPLLFGATITYAENAKQLPHNIKEVHPSVLICVPRIFEKFHDAIWDKVNTSSKFRKNLFLWALKQKKGTLFYKIANALVFKKIRKQFGGNLRLAVSGGASLNENIAKFFYKIGILILEGYGLTETSPVIAVNTQSHFKFGSVGRVLEGTTLQTFNHEIMIKGPGVFSGYYQNEKETTECLTADGWFSTGDLGFVDTEGFLTIIGRKKEMILLSGGKNIWPEPIENVINDDKFITQSVVVGDKQKFVAALVVPDWKEVALYLKEHNLPMQNIEKLVKNKDVLSLFQKRFDEKINPKLSDFDKVKKFYLLHHEFSQEQGELTPTLKLRRHVIAQHCKREIESMYAEDGE